MKESLFFIALILIPTLTSCSVLEELAKSCKVFCELADCFSKYDLICHDGRIYKLPVVTAESINLSKSALPKISKLRITKARIRMIGRGALDNFQNLELIDFSNNYIKHIGFSFFSSFRYLTEIDLSHNEIEDIKEHFGGNLLDFLEVIRLGHNRLTKLHLTVFGTLRRLRILALNDNGIRTIPKHAFSYYRMPFLNHIDLRNNYITHVGDYSFAYLTWFKEDDFLNIDVMPAEIPVLNPFEGVRKYKLDMEPHFTDEKPCSREGRYNVHYEDCQCWLHRVAVDFKTKGFGAMCIMQVQKKGAGGWSQWTKCRSEPGYKNMKRSRHRHCRHVFSTFCNDGPFREVENCPSFPENSITKAYKAVYINMTIQIYINGRLVFDWEQEEEKYIREKSIRQTTTPTSPTVRTRKKKQKAKKKKKVLRTDIFFDDSDRLIQILSTHSPIYTIWFKSYVTSIAICQFYFYLWLLIHRFTKRKARIARSNYSESSFSL